MEKNNTPGAEQDMHFPSMCTECVWMDPPGDVNGACELRSTTGVFSLFKFLLFTFQYL